ncbi:MAG: hypothetical protein RSB48_02420 [Akkermansia sp.]
MKNINLLALVCVLAGGSVQAMNNYAVTPRPASDYARDTAGSISAGYDSRCSYKNVVASPVLNKSGLFSLRGGMSMPIMSSWKQHFGAEYDELLDGALKDRDIFNAFWAMDKEILPNLRAGVGYELNYGGLPGFIAKRMGKVSHSLAQGVHGYVKYDDSGHGYFGSADLQAGFYGLTGWRFDLEGGKRWHSNFSQRVDMELSAGIGFSSSYWGSNIRGVDQLNVKFALPIRTNLMDDQKGIRIVPYIQAAWSGNTRSEINRYCRERVIDQFQLIGGVNVIYNF